MSLADRLRTKTKAAIARYGSPLTLTQASGSSYDPATSGVTTTATNISVIGLVERVRMFQPDRELAPGADVQRAGWKVTLAAASLAAPPSLGDTIGPIEGLTCKVVGLSSDQVEGQTITYELRVSA